MSSGAVPVAAALGSALVYATAGVLQHRAAREAPSGSGLQLGLMASLLGRPLWLAGVVADVVALALHVVALSGGTLALVQPLLVSGVLFALPASAVIERRRPSLAEWLWAVVLIAGLSALLVGGNPTDGASPDDTEALAVATAAAAGLAGVLGIATVALPRHRAALLGAVAGVAYGTTAALLKSVVHLATGGHPSQLLTTWPLYLVVLVGAAALIVSQVAFQAGPLAASLPPLTIVDPVVAIVFGVALFGERLAADPVALVAEVAGAVVMVAATVGLARRSSEPA